MGHTTLVLAGVSSYISGNISFPFFIAKNATVTAYLLESSLARFKKSRLLFYSDKVFSRIQINGMKTYNCFSLAACLFSLR